MTFTSKSVLLHRYGVVESRAYDPGPTSVGREGEAAGTSSPNYRTRRVGTSRRPGGEKFRFRFLVTAARDRRAFAGALNYGPARTVQQRKGGGTA